MNNVKLWVSLMIIVVIGTVFLAIKIIPTNTIIEQPVGSVASPDIMSPYISYGGIMRYSQGAKLTATTTGYTICSLQSPAATSTLVSANVNMQNGSTTAQTLYLAQAATAFATTTALGHTVIAANSGTDLNASSTLLTSAAAITAPSQWIVVGFEQRGANDVIKGTCSAEWVLTKPY